LTERTPRLLIRQLVREVVDLLAVCEPLDVDLLLGHHLCSAATPPGPGAHGMCGANAAERATAPSPDPLGHSTAEI
jgi:hypothetical protein